MTSLTREPLPEDAAAEARPEQEEPAVLVGYSDLSRIYHQLRAAASGVIAAAAMMLGFAWGWTEGLVVAAVALVATVDAISRRRHPGRSAWMPVLLDATAVGMAMLLAGLPTTLMVAPVAYLVTAALLLLPPRRAGAVVAYLAGWIALVLLAERAGTGAAMASSRLWVLSVIAVAVFFGEMAALLTAAARQVREREAVDRRFQQTQARYQVLFERNPQPMWVYDLETLRFLEVNEAAVVHYGYQRADFLSMTIADIRLEADLPRLDDNLARTGDGYDHSGGWRHRRCDGSLIDVEVASQPVEFQGRPARLVLVRDVTDRLRAEEALRVSEERFRRAFDDASVGMALIDPEGGTFVQVNQAFSDLLGYSETELSGRAWSEFSHPDDVPPTLEGLRSVVAGEVPALRTEKRCIRGDGRMIWSSVSASVLRDAQGEPQHILVQAEDVTERKETTERLEDLVATQARRILYEQAIASCSQALLSGTDEDAMDSALEALVMATGAEAVFVERNVEDPEGELYSSRVHRQALGQPTPDPDQWHLVPWTDMPAAHARLSRGEAFSFLTRDLEGEERALYERTGILSELDIPIFSEGRWAGIIGFSDSTTERIWEEDEIRLLKTASEMVGAFWDKREAQERLEWLVRSKDKFIASVSHELRTPLTAVVGFAQELRHSRSRLSPADIDDLLALVADESQEVAYIVEDLLVAARSEIGGVVVVSQPVNLSDELASTLKGFRLPSGRTIDREGEANAWADPGRVRQILRNLVTNAVRYGGERIWIRMAEQGGMAIVEVADDGPGIPAESEQRIFEPYYRAHEASGQPASVGLGLHVSRELARLMGGDVTHRRVDGHTTFQLVLPPARDQAPASLPEPVAS